MIFELFAARADTSYMEGDRPPPETALTPLSFDQVYGIDALRRLFEEPEAPHQIRPLVDYPEPPERMREFTMRVLPGVSDAITELSGRELNVLTHCLLEGYHNHGQRHWRRTAHYRSAEAYLGVYEPPKTFDEIRYGIDPGVSLERVQDTIKSRYASPQRTETLLNLVTTVVRSSGIDTRFYKPPESNLQKAAALPFDKPQSRYADRLHNPVPLVNYPEPPERQQQFVAEVLPAAVSQTVRELPSKELAIASLSLAQRYKKDRGHRLVNETYDTALDYLGLYHPPKAPDATYPVHPYAALRRIREDQSSITVPDAENLLMQAQNAVQSGSSDYAFHTPIELYRDDDWLEGRDEHYRQLFYDREDDTVRSLTHLALTAGKLPPRPITRGMIAEPVSAILEHHEKAAKWKEGQVAIFGLLQPEKNLERITALTAHIVWTWERAWRYHNQRQGLTDTDNPSPFLDLRGKRFEPGNLKEPAVQRVIETAAAVITILQAGYPDGTPGKTFNMNLARFIARFGPDYATKWIAGDIIRDDFYERGLDAEELLQVMHPAARTAIAINYNRDPLVATKRIWHQYTTTLSYQNLMQQTSWDKMRTMKVFPPYVRFQIARHYPTGNSEGVIQSIAELPSGTKGLAPSEQVKAVLSYRNPEAKFEELARRLERLETLADEAQERLGWSAQEVRRLFPPGELRKIALKPGDPLDEIQRIAENYEDYFSTANLMGEHQITSERCWTLFPDHIRRKLARYVNCRDKAKEMVVTSRQLSKEFSLPDRLITRLASERTLKGARARAKLIANARTDCPGNVSQNTWAWAALRLPHGSYEKRLKIVAAYYNALRAATPLSLDASTPQRRSKYIYLQNQSADDPAEVAVEGETGAGDAAERLHELADQAGVSFDQLEALLDHFTSNEAMDSADLAATLEQLRQAAAQDT
ncbi:MAG TPA: hypothetical protein VK674_06370 [Candidatus Limnocylindria bacterium]|nr:hypothetical protein [Candidatus Limnocylindria bacterium]